ncbi:MAG: periplasmic heavy metal sensor [bacterium]
MKMNRMRGLVVGSLSLLATLSLAQDNREGENAEQPEFRLPMSADEIEGEFPIMPAMMLSRELGLSKEQHQTIKAIVSGSVDVMKKLHARMIAAAQKQVELMGMDSPDESGVLKGVDEISNIRRDIARLRVKQMLEIQKVLTLAQRSKMREKMKVKMKARLEKQAQGERHAGREGRKACGNTNDCAAAICPVAPPPKAP